MLEPLILCIIDYNGLVFLSYLLSHHTPVVIHVVVILIFYSTEKINVCVNFHHANTYSYGILVMHASTHVCALGCHLRTQASFLHSLAISVRVRTHRSTV